jgi:hypothetical protein
MSRLHHKRIAIVLLFHSEFNKFTDVCWKITGHKSFFERGDDGDQPSRLQPEHQLDSFIGDATAYTRTIDTTEDIV